MGWTNTIGDPELITVWVDPEFDPKQRAFYYARVIEIPTPRWTVRSALNQGARPDSQDPDGRTALMMAAFNGHTEAAELLLDRGAKADTIDGAGRTALMYAAAGPFPRTVQLLLDLVDSVQCSRKEKAREFPLPEQIGRTVTTQEAPWRGRRRKTDHFGDAAVRATLSRLDRLGFGSTYNLDPGRAIPKSRFAIQVKQDAKKDAAAYSSGIPRAGHIDGNDDDRS